MTEQKASPLLTLPPELRNIIWHCLLVQTRDESSRPPDRFCASVLRTCKQIHYEGTEILYGENVFLAHPSLLATLPSFLLRSKPNRICLPPVTTPRLTNIIRRYFIHVRLDTDPRFSRSQVEESFSGAEELEIEVFQAMYGSCDFSVLNLFEGVRGVGKAVVQGSVGDGRYADWLARCMMSEPGSTVPAYSEKYIGGSKVWSAWQHGNR
ncbi:hypothetical protein BAUCODRAFT_66757 [Baudoinia panamericana UAMH 10762]|uniref:F-box domain-containing protein n=1 Tax=Baudoinia panamericana (strain UAMH 10762) TaxID=717646 RepID=M2N1V6_BAUPA|nr:uncharacterized protein BAUCODRAFT_66757 [Baudoinia panamericana UAMH 10762]EMC97908.1 hypothetical protein BAUCODRAFT_66757 [Baudoinia panamericana UAMH 10762]